MIVVTELGGLENSSCMPLNPYHPFIFYFLVAPQFVLQPGLNMGPLAVKIVLTTRPSGKSHYSFNS